jgi:hypothetical protein
MPSKLGRVRAPASPSQRCHSPIVHPSGTPTPIDEARLRAYRTGWVVCPGSTDARRTVLASGDRVRERVTPELPLRDGCSSRGGAAGGATGRVRRGARRRRRGGGRQELAGRAQPGVVPQGTRLRDGHVGVPGRGRGGRGPSIWDAFAHTPGTAPCSRSLHLCFGLFKSLMHDRVVVNWER